MLRTFPDVARAHETGDLLAAAAMRLGPPALSTRPVSCRLPSAATLPSSRVTAGPAKTSFCGERGGPDLAQALGKNGSQVGQLDLPFADAAGEQAVGVVQRR